MPKPYVAGLGLLLACLFSLENSGCSKECGRQMFLAAGVPKSLAQKKHFDRVFADLRQSGIDVFLPFSEYVEVPESKSLGYERNFFPKLQEDPSFVDAMRKNGIKLLIPASVIYSDETFPPLKDDPLRETVAFLGRENVFGVYSFDEPVLNKKEAICKLLYERVKAIDPTLPVVMVHTPVSEYAKTSSEYATYFNAVRSVSQHSDLAGFDVYAIPKNLMKVHGPFSGPNKVLNYRCALLEHLKWLKQNLPAKKHLIVLQAFCLQDQGHPFWLAKLYGDRRPNKDELKEMVKICVENNASVGWWGQSLVKDQSPKFWQDVLSATSTFSGSGQKEHR